MKFTAYCKAKPSLLSYDTQCCRGAIALGRGRLTAGELELVSPAETDPVQGLAIGAKQLIGTETATGSATENAIVSGIEGTETKMRLTTSQRQLLLVRIRIR